MFTFKPALSAAELGMTSIISMPPSNAVLVLMLWYGKKDHN